MSIKIKDFNENIYTFNKIKSNYNNKCLRQKILSSKRNITLKVKNNGKGCD